jgi:bifunctional DNA-binding transcriptional regulator/antitoxin component of YhaV-PrlF toxin-antitoxin module
MADLRIGPGGQITLPTEVLDRYRLTPDIPIRIIETRDGILLVPQTDEPMSEELQRELDEWQSLGTQTWDQFPYEDTEAGS